MITDVNKMIIKEMQNNTIGNHNPL